MPRFQGVPVNQSQATGGRFGGVAVAPDFSNVQSEVGPTVSVDPPKPLKGNKVTRALGEVGGRQVLQGAYGMYGALGGDALNQYVLNPIDQLIFPAEKNLSGLITGQQPQQRNFFGIGNRTYRDAASALADEYGMRAPQTSGERVVSDIGEALTGTALTMGLGGALTNLEGNILPRVGKFLTAQPALQGASTVTGSGASSTAREAGVGPGGQLVAGLAGGLAPGSATSGAAAATRGLARGRSGEGMQRTIDDFASLGATPTVGQATGSRALQGVENLLGGGPTSTVVVSRFANRQAENIGEGLQRRANELSPKASAERAGTAIDRGVRGTDATPGFLQDTKNVAADLYRRVDETIPRDSRVGVASTREALADLNSMIEGAPSVSRFFQNARLEGIEGALLSDTSGVNAVLTRPGMRERADALRAQLQQESQQASAAAQAYAQQLRGRMQAQAEQIAQRNRVTPTNQQPVPSPAEIDAAVNAEIARLPKPTSAAAIDNEVNQMLAAQVDDSLPYEALQKLRTLVGNEIENVSLVSDVPRSKWKALYGALSRDMEAAATTPEAKQALSRANAYYNARIGRLEAIDSVINRNGGPERIFDAAMSGTREGGTTLRAVMQSLPPEGQRAVTGAVIKRMGLANPNAQDVSGDVFSARTFLTNWNKISPESRAALFDRHGPNFSKSMDQIARVAQNIKQGSEVLSNPSGTANRAAALTYAASLVASMFGGSPLTTGGLVAGGLGANLSARMLTNPNVVKWLARSTALPVGSATAQIQALRRIGENENDPEAIEIADQLDEQERNKAAGSQQQ